MDDVDGHDLTEPDDTDRTDPDNLNESGCDNSDETRSDRPNQSNPCGPVVTADCSVDLPDPQPAVSALPVDLLPSNASSVVASEAGRDLSCDSLQKIRTRYGRVVRPVVRLIQNMYQKVLAGR